MSKAEPSRRKNAGRITDDRGRKVTQLDPIALGLLRQHDVIETEALRRILQEPGVGLKTFERIVFCIQVTGAILVVCFFTYETITGGIASAIKAKSVGLIYLCMLPWIVWFGMKRKRFSSIKPAMLKHHRCPHCGYDLRGLEIDADDRATVCPECGCAWKLPEATGQASQPTSGG
jgi:hypothetical protein